MTMAMTRATVRYAIILHAFQAINNTLGMQMCGIQHNTCESRQSEKKKDVFYCPSWDSAHWIHSNQRLRNKDIASDAAVAFDYRKVHEHKATTNTGKNDTQKCSKPALRNCCFDAVTDDTFGSPPSMQTSLHVYWINSGTDESFGCPTSVSCIEAVTDDTFGSPASMHTPHVGHAALESITQRT